jgi:2-oxoglutarate ferredoxin oxidoreductase subunit alpha
MPPGALILINTGSFTKRNYQKAGMDTDYLHSGALDPFRVVELDMSALTSAAVAESGLGRSDALRCKNFWALGVVLWMFSHSTSISEAWIKQKFAADDAVMNANLAALKAGNAFAETAELAASLPDLAMPPAPYPPGEYRTITGAEALSLGLAAAAQLAGRRMIFCSYPITPASPILHHLARMGELGISTFQAEDEIAAIGAAIGASYGGALGVTSSSGPGIALKTEAMGLAISAELPLVIINSQRGGPSTGLPTKTEQSDLYQAVYGRNADAPLPVIAAASPGDSFHSAIEAARIAVRHMTPVMLLTDGYLNNAAWPWPIPSIADIEPIVPGAELPKTGGDTAGAGAAPGEHPAATRAFTRDERTLARPWITPGMEDLMHRVGGLEKDIVTGAISYDPDNHQAMGEFRADKLKSVQQFIPDQEIETGEPGDEIVVVGWGSTFGAIWRAVNVARRDGHSVSHIQVRYLHPLPANLGELLGTFRHIIVPELNMGQLATVLRDKLGIDPVQLNKVSGLPLKISEVADAIHSLSSHKSAD